MPTTPSPLAFALDDQMSPVAGKVAAAIAASLLAPETTAKLTAHATGRAAKLVSEALASLAEGRKTFVKGKPVMVPYSDEARRIRKELQLSAFEDGNMRILQDVGEVLLAIGERWTEAEGETMAEAAVALYCAAGHAEVERLWNAAG